MNRTLWMLAAGTSVVIVAPAPLLASQTYLREADAPKVVFPDSTAAVRKNLTLSDVELKTVSLAAGRPVDGRSYAYLEVRKGDAIVGWIFLLDVIGQSEPITFGVGVARDRTLKDLEVMVYREPRGEEIRQPRFRRQFSGKRISDPIALGKDIDAISGATISSRSATYAARKALALAEVLRARADQGGK